MNTIISRSIIPVIFGMLLLYSCFSFGQVVQRNEEANDTYAQVITRVGSFTYSGAKIKTVGSLYLYEDWNNEMVVHLNDGENVLIKNVNYNLADQVFEVLTAPDSTYHFDFTKLKSIKLNGKLYKQFEMDGAMTIFEIVFQESYKDNFAILKKYYVNEFKASPDPMVNRPNNTYTTGYTYYLKNGDDIEKVHLNKKGILKMFKSKNISKDKVEDYVKANNLSYKAEEDVESLFKHFFVN